VQGVLDSIPIILILVAGITAPVAGWYATLRARSSFIWFVLGALTGPIALGLLAVSPPGRCPTCDTPIQGWPTVCDRCGDVLPARLAGANAPMPPPRTYEAETPGETSHAMVSRPTTGTSRPVAVPTPIGSARTASRRDQRATWPERPMVSPMSLGIRPTITPSNFVAATVADPPPGDVLSTGVYLSGNAGMEVGACYAIARDGDQLRVFGPVDAGQLTVRHEGPVRDFDVTAMDDRLIITGREGRSTLAIVFRTIGGMRAAELELALGGPIAGTAT
jgi:hypothetical protein